MPERTAEMAKFLANHGWAEAAQTALAGDASDRRYHRLRRTDGTSAVLMDTPVADRESVATFVRINGHLQNIGLSAPSILAAEIERGFLLLEDFGNQTVAQRLDQAGTDPCDLYAHATDVILHMQAHPAPADLMHYSAGKMAEASMLVFDEYETAAQTSCESTARADMCEALGAALEVLDAITPVFAHRDYHVENLMDLPQRQGVRRLGIIDHQDAVLCHPAYDLASLIYDARRDVPPDVAAQMMGRFATATGSDLQTLTRDIALLNAQRNLRILGIFAKLARVKRKPHYTEMLPRVWRHVQTAFKHPDLQDVAKIARTTLTPPDARVLKKLSTV